MEPDKSLILVVDDEANAREVMQRALAQFGYQCRAAQDAASASELLKREAVHLMLLDIIMPIKSGMDYLPEVVAKYRDTAVVMLTAVGDTSIAAQAVREGAYEFITKPVDHGELISKVERTLERRARALELRRYQWQLEQSLAQRTGDLEQRMRALSAIAGLSQAQLIHVLDTQHAHALLQTKIDELRALVGWAFQRVPNLHG